MNNLEINQHLLDGNLDKPEVLPHLEQLSELPFIFEQDFGLKQLPTEPGILMIRGSRQYGKSTWLEQQIRLTIEECGPGSALYLNGDEIANNNELLVAIRNLVKLFPSNQNIKRIFIDEITAIDAWEKALKRLVDAGELRNILVVTTGSKAIDLRRGLERLPGRKGNIERTDYIFTPISYAEFHNKCAATFGADTLHAYILSGGSAIGANSLAKYGYLAEYVLNTVADWVFGEFARSGRSRSNLIAVLSAIYKYAPNPVGQSKLARESNLANNTVAKSYIEILADLMLVLPAYVYDKDKNATIFRKECKYHFTNVFFAMCMHPQRPKTIATLRSMPPTMFAVILEWVVAQEIWRQSCIANKNLDFLNFWQNSEHEINFVVPEQDLWLEVKSGNEQVTNFLWATKILQSKQKLTVINQQTFDSQKIIGVTLQDFLLSTIFEKS